MNIPAPRAPQGRLLTIRIAALAIFTGAALAAPMTQAAVSAEQQDLVERVMQRLLAVVEPQEQYDAWPPEWRVIDEDGVNAFAALDPQRPADRIPIVRVYRGLIERIAEMNEDRLAFVLGHELAHLTLGHVTEHAGDTAVLATAFGREQEIEADIEGMKLALAAGFSYRAAMGAPQQFHELGLDYTSFEGMSTDHPSWVERLALLESDEQQQQYWRAMSAFQTGVFFLKTQNYFAAEEAFKQVTEEFPKCYEAFVNLGFAQLMQYADSLQTEDLRELGVGQLIVGGFYERPTLTRGNNELWWDAVGNLQRALLLKDDLLLAKANLALAYLIHPSGSPDVGQAAQLYAEVAELLEDPEATANVGPLARAALLANAWVGLYHSDEEQNAAIMAQIEAYLAQAEQSSTLRASAYQVRAALGYTQATALAAADDPSDKQQAIELFEQYLTSTPSTSAWWPLAYDQYRNLAEALGVEPKDEEAFQQEGTDGWRPVAGVELPDGQDVNVAAPVRPLIAKLDSEVTGERIFGRFPVRRYDFPAYGMSLLGGRNVIAIVLSGSEAPPVQLRRGVIGDQGTQLTIGMSRADVEALLGDAWSSTQASIIDPDVKHEFYEDVGVAVRYGADDAVVEIIITVAPHEGRRR